MPGDEAVKTAPMEKRSALVFFPSSMAKALREFSTRLSDPSFLRVWTH
jgi:hypothetical protein